MWTPYVVLEWVGSWPWICIVVHKEAVWKRQLSVSRLYRLYCVLCTSMSIVLFRVLCYVLKERKIKNRKGLPTRRSLLLYIFYLSIYLSMYLSICSACVFPCQSKNENEKKKEQITPYMYTYWFFEDLLPLPLPLCLLCILSNSSFLPTAFSNS